MVKFDINQLKTQLKLGMGRIKLQQNKKGNIVKAQKRAIAELLAKGSDESARIKVESVIREDFLIEAYDILQLFCEVLLTRIQIISTTPTLPEEIKEAAFTLVYAAPRTEIPELRHVASILTAKYGQHFAQDASDNCCGQVNARVVHKLKVQTPETFLVYQYLNEIARSHGVAWHHDPPPSDVGMFAPSMGGVGSNIGAFMGGGAGSFASAPISEHLHTPGAPDANPFPSFPSVPSTSGDGGSVSGQLNTFPSPPSASFAPPSFPGATSPAQHPSAAFPAFPAFPAAPQNNAPPNNEQNMGHINNAFPSFPTPPSSSSSNNNAFPSFPSFPSTQSPSASNPSFPTFPSAAPVVDLSSIDLRLPPAPSASSNTDHIPDFDELTARFEALKKRNM